MKILILAYGGDTPAGYDYLLRVARAFEKKEHNVIFAIDNQYFVDASFADLSSYKVYNFDEWNAETEKKENNLCNNTEISISTGVSYVNFERLRCWNAKKSLQNYKNHIEQDIIYRYLDFFIEIIDKENISCIVHETVSSLQAYMAFEAATFKHIPYIGWIVSRIPGRFELYTDPFGNIAELKNEMDNVALDDISDEEMHIIKSYIDNVGAIKPDYMKNNPYNMDIDYIKQYLGKLGKAYSILKVISRADVSQSYYIKYPLELKLAIFKHNLKRQLKIRFLKKYFCEESESDTYFLYPLHYQPEASTAVNAPYYCNQAEVIRCIAFSLPRKIKLYVKDHPNGIGFLSKSTYEQIFELPNVKYINPKSDTKTLIKKSKGIITITGTMGYESLLMNKPVVTLGNVFYNAHPYCYHVGGYDELYPTMIRILTEKEEKLDFATENLRFVKAYRNRSYEGKLLDCNDENVEKVVNAIFFEVKKYYGLHE